MLSFIQCKIRAQWVSVSGILIECEAYIGVLVIHQEGKQTDIYFNIFFSLIYTKLLLIVFYLPALTFLLTSGKDLYLNWKRKFCLMRLSTTKIAFYY